MPNMEKLKDKIEDSGMTIVSVCEKAGVERATLYNRLNGRGEWKASEMIGITDALNLTNEEREEIFLS